MKQSKRILNVPIVPRLFARQHVAGCLHTICYATMAIWFLTNSVFNFHIDFWLLTKENFEKKKSSKISIIEMVNADFSVFHNNAWFCKNSIYFIKHINFNKTTVKRYYM